MSELADYYQRLSNSLGSLIGLVGYSLEPCAKTAILNIRTAPEKHPIKEKTHLTAEFIQKLRRNKKSTKSVGESQRIKQKRTGKRNLEKTERAKPLKEKTLIRKEETEKRISPSHLRAKPYYIVIEEKYVKNFEIPELNRRKEELKRRREMFLPGTTVKPLKKGNLCKSDTRFNTKGELKKAPVPKFNFTIKRPIVETELAHIVPRKDCEYLELRRNIRRKLENELIKGTANKGKNLDETAKRNEGLLRYRYSPNFFDVQAIEAKDRINELYIESIKSKLDMLL